MTTSGGSSGGSSSSPTPVSQSSAPKGAYLGSVGDGKKKVSLGNGQSIIVDESSGSDTVENFSIPRGRNGAPLDIKAVNTSIVSGASSTPQAHMGSSDNGNVGRGGAVDTTVTQKPTPGAEGPEGTVVTSGPRSDFSVVLAGQTGKRPDRSPARSNNFVSLVGSAGGLGRRTSEAKRSLIGGA